VGLVSGLPLPGPTVCAAKATPDTDMLSAIISATTNNVTRFFIFSPPFPFSQTKPADLTSSEGVAGCATGSARLLSAHLYESELLGLYPWDFVLVVLTGSHFERCPRCAHICQVAIF
jgi:hypothetical protein